MALYNYINSNGTIVPDTGSIKTDVETEYQATFGADLVVTPNTPQGVLIVAETLARSAVAENNAMLANQINPNLAGGIFLDAIMQLTGMQRQVGTFSTVSVLLTGVAGTIIPAGSQIRDPITPANIFQSVSSVTLAVNGQATVNFQSLIAGPVGVLNPTTWQIVSGILGWETANNATPFIYIQGQATESDGDARNRRRDTIAIQGASTALAITSGLSATPGVRSLSFRENIGPATATIDGVSMISHSIYVCVDGGLDLDVATTLTNKKSAGAAYNNGATGATPISQNVIIPESGQIIAVLFDRPQLTRILVRATVKQDAAIQDPEMVVKQAILQYTQGTLSGEPGLIVGASVSPFELAGAVNQVSPGIYIQKMEVALYATTPVFVTIELPMDIWQLATIADTDITVTIL